MKFGLWDHVDRSDRPFHKQLDERLAFLIRGDELGYHGFHVAEHHATPLNLVPVPGVYLGAVARLTSRMRISVLCYLLPLYSPLRLIEEVAILDNMSHGRLDIGVGRGVSPFELNYHNVDPETAREVFLEALDVLVKGMTQEKLDHQGKRFSYKSVPIEVRPLQQDATEIPKDIDVLMLAQADDLTREAAFAVDQFALGGGKVLVLVDPVAEMARVAMGPMGAMMPGSRAGKVDKLLTAWGVAFDRTKVAGDIAYARRVQFGARGPGPRVAEYVPWLVMDKQTLDERDVLSGGIDRLNFASAGALAKADGAATDFRPIVQTSDKAMLIDADKISTQPDAVALLRGYKQGGKRLTLAARVSGPVKSAFPNGAPPPMPEPKAEGAKEGEAKDAKAADQKAGDAKAKDAKPAGSVKPSLKEGRVNAIVIADTDMLFDQLWVDVREFLGQQVAVPNASNNAFVIGALDNLSGSDALISLRGRGVGERPFELVKEIRTESERKFRDKEQALTTKLKEVQGALAKLEKGGDGESLILTDKDRQTIDKFRTEMLSIRRELRDVKLALRQDIDALDARLKFLNIAAVPLLIGLGGFGFAAWRRRRTARWPTALRRTVPSSANLRPARHRCPRTFRRATASSRACRRARWWWKPRCSRVRSSRHGWRWRPGARCLRCRARSTRRSPRAATRC